MGKGRKGMESRFARYAEVMVETLGHADRIRPALVSARAGAARDP